MPRGVSEIHHEVELGVVIGEGGSHIPEADALRHVAGYTLALDMTDRAKQNQLKNAGAYFSCLNQPPLLSWSNNVHTLGSKMVNNIWSTRNAYNLCRCAVKTTGSFDTSGTVLFWVLWTSSHWGRQIFICYSCVL